MGQFQRDAVKVFKALGDPTRYRIILLLMERKELGCADFAEQFDLTLPAMSHHYRVLENAGLVFPRKQGNHIFLRLDEAQLRRFMPEFEHAHLGSAAEAKPGAGAE